MQFPVYWVGPLWFSALQILEAGSPHVDLVEKIAFTVREGKSLHGKVFGIIISCVTKRLEGELHVQRIFAQALAALQVQLFLGVGDAHGVGGCDLEALEGVPGLRGLQLRLKLNKGNVASSRNQTHLLETWEPGMEIRERCCKPGNLEWRQGVGLGLGT